VRDLLVDALACFRLTRLVTEDVVTQPFRQKIFDKHPPTEESWSYVLTCPWCASIWVGGGIALLRKFYPQAWNPAAEMLAFSAAVGLVAEREANHGSL
jgi:hypothetical protein